MADFRFGVATADHQCEAYDGRDDIRDVWDRVRGLTQRGNATDFWNRYKEDVDLAKGLGCRVFRLSLSWTRLEPEPGVWDEASFAHYRDVLQYMRDAGMQTVVTLHHNVWPLHVQAAGNGAGMLDRGFPARMAGYATQVAQRLGDLIDYYLTLNEPNQLVYGYIKGFWMRAYAVPPGLPPFATGAQQMDAVLQLIPNLFLAHARSRAAIQKVRPNAKVGTNPLVLGLPRWLQRLIDRNATHLKSPEHAKLQARRLEQTSILERGKVDVSIAQLTMMADHLEDVMFSEAYYIAKLATLGRSGASTGSAVVRQAHHDTAAQRDKAAQPDAQFQGCVGVVQDGAPALQVSGYFPAADIRYFDDMESAVAALRARTIDLLFGDDAVLRQHASDEFVLNIAGTRDQPYGVAVPIGSRALLNAVDQALRDYKKSHPELPKGHNRKNVSDIGRPSVPSTSSGVLRQAQDDTKNQHDQNVVPNMDKSLQAIRKRGKLRVAVHPGVANLCIADGSGSYSGLEPDIARHIAKFILGSETAVQFVPLNEKECATATRSWLKMFDGLRKSFAMFGTLIGTNWWNLGLAGKLPEFLCPKECVGTIDFVGLDYYWGIPSIWPGSLERLAAASEFRYASAPVWPGVLESILREAQDAFPGKPIILIENGCVTSADGYSRAQYLSAHVERVKKAIARGVPIVAYLCWSITSNREWGLPFDNNSDFGLFYIDLDHDPELKRVPTPASQQYAEIIRSFPNDAAVGG